MEKTKSFSNNRRDAKRYELPLKLTYLDPVTNRHEETLAKNICKNGLRFKVNAKMQKGTHLNLKIEDPFSISFIFSDAEIMWADEFVTGDEVEDISHEVGVRLLKKRLY